MLASNSTVEAAVPALLVQLSACGGTAAWQDVRFRDLSQLLVRQRKDVEAKLMAGTLGRAGSKLVKQLCSALLASIASIASIASTAWTVAARWARFVVVVVPGMVGASAMSARPGSLEHNIHYAKCHICRGWVRRLRLAMAAVRLLDSCPFA